jgi:hypothetical protein
MPQMSGSVQEHNIMIDQRKVKCQCKSDLGGVRAVLAVCLFWVIIGLFVGAVIRFGSEIVFIVLGLSVISIVIYDISIVSKKKNHKPGDDDEKFD